MSTILEPYLNFNDGKCEAALNFYQAALGGELEIMRYGDAPMPCDENNKNLIMHCYFKSGQVSFMASDCTPEHGVKIGNNVNMSLNFTDEAEQTRVFDALSNGGTVSFPLDDMFWGARFGMLVDQFGVSWMLNCAKKPA